MESGSWEHETAPSFSQTLLISQLAVFLQPVPDVINLVVSQLRLTKHQEIECDIPDLQPSRLKSSHYPPTGSPAMSPDVRHNFLSMIQQFRPRATFPFQQSTHALSRKSPRSFSASTVVHSYPRSLAARTTRTFSRKMATFNPDYEHFFRYTSGRWLWDEEQQLRDRYKAFNVAELQIVAAQAIGSGNCVSMIKLAEGGYNKVFRLLMGDGKQVLARIPNPNAGPPFYTTASEVATMQFVS